MDLRLDIAVVTMVIVLCGQMTSASWDGGQRKWILKIHNDYRKGVKGACDMEMMIYDRQLEKEAKAWANRCVFEHEHKSRGENIAWHTKYGQENVLIKKMADMWYNEVKDFRYGAYSCGAACHYTQMVWSKTTKVGCYAADCSRLRKGGNNAYFLVCFYSPAGNMMGENPYQTKCGPGNKKKTNNGPTNQGNNNNNNNDNNRSGNHNNVIRPNNNNNNNNNNNPFGNINWQSGGGQPDWNALFSGQGNKLNEGGSNNQWTQTWSGFGPNGGSRTYKVYYKRY